MLLLNEEQQNKVAAGLLTIGLAVSLNVGYRAFFPPKVVTPEQASAIAQAQFSNERVSVNYASKPYLNSLLWKLFLATGCFSAAYALADGTDRKTFQPDVANPVSLRGLEDGTDQRPAAKKRRASAANDVQAATDFHHEVSTLVGKWCNQFPWLVGMLRSPIVMVIGQPGSGKSSIMQTIALVRHLMFHCGVDIADLDLDKNIKNKVWVHGTAYGSKKRGDYFTQLSQLFSRLEPEMFPKSIGHTFVWDEVSRMVHQGICSEDELIAKFETTHKEFRRQNIKTIMGLHGLGVDENMKSKSCGMFTTMRDSAAILFLHPKNDATGDPEFSGLASFKPAGQKTGVVTNFMNNWPRIAIPKSFQAKNLLAMLGEAADHGAIGIIDPDHKAKSARFGWAATSVDTTLTSMGVRKSDQEESEEATQLSKDFSAHLRTRVIDFTLVDDLDQLQEFWCATSEESVSATIHADDKGAHRIRNIWRGWARNQDWEEVSDFKEYLEELEAIGIGTTDKFTWTWNDRADFPWRQ